MGDKSAHGENARHAGFLSDKQTVCLHYYPCLQLPTILAQAATSTGPASSLQDQDLRADASPMANMAQPVSPSDDSDDHAVSDALTSSAGSPAVTTVLGRDGFEEQRESLNPTAITGEFVASGRLVPVDAKQAIAGTMRPDATNSFYETGRTAQFTEASITGISSLALLYNSSWPLVLGGAMSSTLVGVAGPGALESNDVLPAQLAHPAHPSTPTPPSEPDAPSPKGQSSKKGKIVDKSSKDPSFCHGYPQCAQHHENPKKYKRNADLLRHIRATHKGICGNCGVNISRRDAQKRHDDGGKCRPQGK